MRIKTEADGLLAMIREGRTMSAGQKVRLAVMLSVPAVVGNEGVETHVPITMNVEETKKLQESAATLKEIIEDIKL